QDSSGRAFGRKMVLSANEEGVWVPYLWKHPTTGEEAWKLSLVRRAENGEVLGVGVYLPPQ
ncbi:MAG: cache domain-containing protein, partial [Parvibaculales bacterium]